MAWFSCGFQFYQMFHFADYNRDGYVTKNELQLIVVDEYHSIIDDLFKEYEVKRGSKPAQEYFTLKEISYIVYDAIDSNRDDELDSNELLAAANRFSVRTGIPFKSSKPQI